MIPFFKQKKNSNYSQSFNYISNIHKDRKRERVRERKEKEKNNLSIKNKKQF